MFQLRKCVALRCGLSGWVTLWRLELPAAVLPKRDQQSHRWLRLPPLRSWSTSAGAETSQAAGGSQ